MTLMGDSKLLTHVNGSLKYSPVCDVVIVRWVTNHLAVSDLLSTITQIFFLDYEKNGEKYSFFRIQTNVQMSNYFEGIRKMGFVSPIGSLFF